MGGPGVLLAPVPLAWSAAVGLVTLAVYLVQCPPVSGDKDSSELALVLALNGVAHPTGYPLYTLIGHPFVRALHLLGSSWEYAANAWSAVGGAIAMLFLHAFSVRLVPEDAPLGRRGRFLLALLPVAFMAFNPLWTVEATLAEVHSWDLAWVCGAAFLFAVLVRRLCGTAPLPGALRRGALAWGIVCGIGGTHHTTTALLVAAPLTLALALELWRARRLRLSDVLLAPAAGLLPMLSYGLVAYRAFHPALMTWPLLEPSWSGVLHHVLGSQYRHGLGAYHPSPEQQGLLARYCWPFLFAGLALWLAAPWLEREPRQRALSIPLLAVVALFIVFTFNYGFDDPSSYFIVPLGLGFAGMMPLATALASRRRARPRTTRAAWGLAALAALALALPWLRVGQERAQAYVSLDRLIHSMWTSIPADSGFVIWSNDMYARLHEYQCLHGEKPGLTVVHPSNLIQDFPRRRFRERFGFDPAEGVAVAAGADRGPDAAGDPLDAYLAAVYQHINGQTPLPVILFEPEKPSVRMLKKPGAPGDAGPGRGSTAR